MRPRAITSPLHALVAALPDEALRPLILELLRDAGTMPAAAPAAPTEDPAPRARRPYKRRRGSRPPGRKRRGRPRKPPDRSSGVDPGIDPKIIAHRERAKLWARKKRAAAKLAKAEQAPAETSNGKASPPKVTAAALWDHAELLAPKTPWRAVAKEFGANEARMLDCYRARGLPPGVAVNAIERFLELAPTA